MVYVSTASVVCFLKVAFVYMVIILIMLKSAEHTVHICEKDVHGMKIGA